MCGSTTFDNMALRLEQGQNIKYIQNQRGHASIQTTIDRYGHLLKEVNTEQAMKLDNALNFREHLGGSSDCVRRLLEEFEPVTPCLSSKRRKGDSFPV